MLRVIAGYDVEYPVRRRDGGDPLYPPWVLILVLGLRKGEALGLIRETLYEDTGEIHLA